MEVKLVKPFCCIHLPSKPQDLTSQLPDLGEDGQKPWWEGCDPDLLGLLRGRGESFPSWSSFHYLLTDRFVSGLRPVSLRSFTRFILLRVQHESKMHLSRPEEKGCAPGGVGVKSSEPWKEIHTPGIKAVGNKSCCSTRLPLSPQKVSKQPTTPEDFEQA